MDTQTWSAELEDIFVNQRPRLCCVAAKVLGNTDQADDVVQDAYLKISEATTLFEIKQPISYVSRVVRNLAIDRCRRSVFESALFAKEEEGDNASCASHSPEVIAIDRQALALVVDALDGGCSKLCVSLVIIGRYDRPGVLGNVSPFATASGSNFAQGESSVQRP